MSPACVLVAAEGFVPFYYSCVKEYNLNGKDIMTLDGQQEASCRLACSTKPDCTFYVLSTTNTCWLRKDFDAGPDGTTEPAADIMTTCAKSQPSGEVRCVLAITQPDVLVAAMHADAQGTCGSSLLLCALIHLLVLQPLQR